MSQIPGRGIKNLDDRCAVCDDTTLIGEMLASSNVKKMYYCSNLYQECKGTIHKINRFVEAHTCLLQHLDTSFTEFCDRFKSVSVNESVYTYKTQVSFLQFIERIKYIYGKVCWYLNLMEQQDQSDSESTLNTIANLNSCEISSEAGHHENMSESPAEHIEEQVDLLQIEQGEIPILRPRYAQSIGNLENISMNEIGHINGSNFISDQNVIENEEIMPHGSPKNSFDNNIVPLTSVKNVDDKKIMKHTPWSTPKDNESETVEKTKNIFDQKMDHSHMQQILMREQMLSKSINSKTSVNGRQHQDCVEVDQRKFPNWDCIKRNPQKQQINLNNGNRVHGERFENEQQRKGNPMQGVSQKGQHEFIQNQAVANNPRVPKNHNQKLNIRKITNSNEYKDNSYNNNMSSELVNNGNDSDSVSVKLRKLYLDLQRDVQKAQNRKIITSKQNFNLNKRNMENKNCKAKIKKNFTTKLDSLLQDDLLQWKNEMKLYDSTDSIKEVTPKKNRNKKYQKKKKYQGNSNDNDQREHSFCNKNKRVFNKNETLQRDDTCEQEKNGKYIVKNKNDEDSENNRKEKQGIFYNCNNSLPRPKGKSESESDNDMNDTMDLSELREYLKLQKTYHDLNTKYNQ